MIGPFRGGRVNGVTGVPGQPNTFYFGSVGGGFGRSDNSGRTWTPIFDDQQIASIGAIAVAPSNPNIVYVGTGEADMRSQISYGDGMYKSTDAGKTWTHIGLENTRQIGTHRVDPRNPNIVFVAALGHVYGPNPDRGMYRSKDGGETWEKVLYKRRKHRRDRRRHRPDEFAERLRRRCGTHGVRRGASTRHATARAAASSNPPTAARRGSRSTNGIPVEGQGRIGIDDLADESETRLRDRRREGRRPVPFGRCRRDMDADRPSEKRIWGRGWYFCKVVVDPKEPGHRLRLQHLGLQVDRRRQDDGQPSKELPAATIITSCGSIPTTRSG